MVKVSQKYGLFSYKTENIGDEIQSIAARQFLPQIDHYIDRDQVSKFRSPAGEKTKLIMNGWYMHDPANWPPLRDQIDPLLISMHIDQKDKNVALAFKSRSSKEFLKKYGPVGARDKATQIFLEKNGIPAYFSGCLTLTLQRDKSLPRQKFVLAVDVSKKVLERIKKLTDRPVIELSTYYDPSIGNEARFMLAEYFLYLYQSAHCTVTTRLHTMLPSLAFETPVLLIKDPTKFDKERYSGLVELVHSAEEKTFINDPKIFDVNKPPKNPTTYLELRKEIIKKCQKFSGLDDLSKSFRTIDLAKLYQNPLFIDIFSRSLASSYKKLLLEGDVSWAKRQTQELRDTITNQQAQLTELQTRLDLVLGSRSWRATEPLRQAGRLAHKTHRKLSSPQNKTISAVKEKRLSYLEEAALDDILMAVKSIEKKNIPGKIIEAGVALGGSAIVIASAKTQQRKLELYDVFGMIPEPTSADGDDVHKRYQEIKSGQSTGIDGDTYYGYQKDLIKKVKESFKQLGFDPRDNNIKFVKGLYEDTLKVGQDEQIALAHIDCDWYESVKVCLERIVPRLSIGGRLILDDYYAWSGCRTAVDEYFAGKSSFKFHRRARLQIEKVG